jgi:hypothetical protein
MIGSALGAVGFGDVLPLTLTAAGSLCELQFHTSETNNNRVHILRIHSNTDRWAIMVSSSVRWDSRRAESWEVGACRRERF